MRKTAYISLACIGIYFVVAFAVTQLDRPRKPPQVLSPQEQLHKAIHERDSLKAVLDSMRNINAGIIRVFQHEGKNHVGTMQTPCIEKDLFGNCLVIVAANFPE